MANPTHTINKVTFGGDTLIDLSGDDVTAGDVMSGKTFHLPNGEQSTGTYTPSGGDLTYVNFNTQLSSSSSSSNSSVLDVGSAGNEMRYGGALFNRGSSYTGTLYLQGSNNNSTWTDITNVSRNSAGYTAFTGTNSTYRYYRLRLTANRATNNVACGMMMVCIK